MKDVQPTQLAQQGSIAQAVAGAAQATLANASAMLPPRLIGGEQKSLNSHTGEQIKKFT